MNPFLEAVKAFSQGNFTPFLHSECSFRKADKTFIDGKPAVMEHLREHPDFFKEMEIISPESIWTMSLKNAEGNLIKMYSENGLIHKISEFKPDEVRQRVRCVISYDGTNFAGFQTQNDVRTVQKEIASVVSVVNDYLTPVTGSSRTDSGVHAYGQVIHFDTHHDFIAQKWKMILNHALPEDIHVEECELVHPLFHARFDVISKEYRYVINLGEYCPLRRHYEWTIHQKIDLDVLQKELKKIEGTFDFASFCKGENEVTVRTIYEASMELNGTQLVLKFRGNGFLHNMIRLIVGSLIDIASGKSEMDMNQLIDDQNRTHTKSIAPGWGLYLVKINY